MTSRKKPGVAFWATVVVTVALLAYPLSAGPWCWALGKWGPKPRAIRVTGLLFRPVMHLSHKGPTQIAVPLNAYLEWCFECGHAERVD
jgi:hypothetical protein